MGYGPELLVGANCTDDMGGSEANATSGWAGSHSLDVIESSFSSPYQGTYCLRLVDGSGAYANRSVSISATGTYKFSIWAKYGSGLGSWEIILDDASVGTVSSTTSSWSEFTLTAELTAGNRIISLCSREDGTAEVFFDAASLREVTAGFIPAWAYASTTTL
jgi:hypothetical protein